MRARDGPSPHAAQGLRAPQDPRRRAHAPVATPREWAAVHALPLAAWGPALASFGRAWGLDGYWERLPGGEDSAVFAPGSTVLKLVPPLGRADAEDESAVPRRLAPSLPALLHLDPNHGNVMLTRRAGRWELPGVLDFVASRAC